MLTAVAVGSLCPAYTIIRFRFFANPKPTAVAHSPQTTAYQPAYSPITKL
jgi:hypothetical protein